MAHRIREAMRDGGLAPLGGDGGIVEADETYFGQTKRTRSRQSSGMAVRIRNVASRGPAGKRAVVALVERGGRVRSFHPAVADGATVAGIVRENIDRETRLHTDESNLYIQVGKEYSRARNGEPRCERIRARRCDHKHR